MRVTLILICLQVALAASSQDLKSGLLSEQHSSNSISHAHIQNMSQQKFTVTNDEGKFQIPIYLGDSLWISCVGYQSMGVIITKEWIDLDEINIQMSRDTILLDALTITRLPSEVIFKQKMLKFLPEDEPGFYGMPKIEMGTPNILNDNYVKSAAFAISHPFGFIYHNTSKKQKEKRKMQKIEDNQLIHWKINEKYNRNYVGELTKLSGTRLTDFIAFCDFPQEFLEKSSQYQIAEAIKSKFILFNNEGKG